MLRGSGGYADLLLARRDGDTTIEAVAELVGYAYTPRLEPHETAEAATPPDPGPQGAGQPGPKPPPETPADVPFWQPYRRDFLAPLEDVEPLAPEPEDSPPAARHTIPTAPPRHRPLRPWNALLPGVRSRFADPRPGHAPDVAALIRPIAEGRLLHRLPRLRRRRWGPGVQVILDRSDRLIPFQDDQDAVARRLATLFPRQAVQFCLLQDGLAEPLIWGRKSQLQPYRLPDPDTLVVALSDFGGFADWSPALVRPWRALGGRLARAGCRLAGLDLTPASFGRRPDLGPWTVLPWDRGRSARLTEAERQERAEALLRLLSPAVRIDLGLLREIRLLLGANADAGTEADIWRHADMAHRSRVGGALDTKARDRHRKEFAQKEDGQRQAAVIETIQRWCAGIRPEVWYEALLSLPPETLAHLPARIRQHDLPAAAQDLKAVAPLLDQSPEGRRWYRRVHRRAPASFYNHADPALTRAQHQAYALAFEGEAEPPVPPPGFDPRVIPPAFAAPVTLELREGADGLVVTQPAADDAPRAGSLVCTLQSRIREVTVAPEPSFWRSGQAPTWASDWGTDRFGAWAAFTVTGADGAPVTQRLRWIRPGRFLMGSPDSDPERRNNEGPQHAVVFERGFWLFDTACSQALYQAVMGNNPSQFQGPDRPVEGVSWDDVQTFLERINGLVPGLSLSLPSEAQWEYACRAGTTTPFSFGTTITPEQVNYDGNHPYAGGDKGVYRGETVPVASLPPNPWGLYEMHGNVWEWCADQGHASYVGAPQDGSAWLRPEAHSGARRVLRGGSWRVRARHVRSAVRYHDHPGGRFVSLGFRCARVQETGAEPRSSAAEPGGAGPDGQAERPSAPAPEGGAALRCLDGTGQAPLPPQAAPFVLGTDRERVTLHRLTRPDWAHALGRDRFGLWADIAIDPDPKPLTDQRPVRQRLRWIPPGRFLMGSPEDEPGRYNDEGPQHEVTLVNGFWLFDTPCTQALWQAVMGENPSRFRSPDRPVEQVSWNDAQTFLERINGLVPGLGLSLPSEAQWEYACRAGTTTPFSFGTTITPEQVNYDGNHPYAGGDRGVYRGETVPVASLPPNPWGLYEMHGNVWEWCADHWHGSYDGAPQDGSAWLRPEAHSGASRVFRGGSWSVLARLVRSAYRDRGHPGVRHDGLGFRCARVQGTGAEPRSGAAEPGGVGPDGQAERPSAPAPTGGAAPQAPESGVPRRRRPRR